MSTLKSEEDRVFALELLKEGNLSPEEGSRLMDSIEAYDAAVKNQDGTVVPEAELSKNIAPFGFEMDSPGDIISQQGLSATKGMGNLMHNTGTFAIDVLSAATPDHTDFQGFLNGMRQSVLESQAEWNAFARNAVIELSGTEPSGIGEFVGETLPFFALPTSLSTYVRTLAYQGGVGAAAGGAFNTEAQNLTERIPSMGFGALLGIGTSAVFNAKSGFESYASRRFLQKFESDIAKANQELEGRLQGITGDFDFNFSMGQITADPFVTGLEFGAAHTVQRNAQNGRIASLVNFLTKRAESLSKRGDVEQIAIDLNQTMTRLSDETLSAAGASYAAGMDDLIAKHGDDIVLDARGYLDKARELAGELADPRRLGSPSAVPNGLRLHIEHLDDRINPFKSVRTLVKDEKGRNRVVYEVRNKQTGEVIETHSGRGSQTRALSQVEQKNLAEGGLTSDDLIEVLIGNRQLASGQVPLFENLQLGSTQNLAAALKGALLESMEGGNSKAISGIQAVRQEYAQQMVKLNRIRNTMLANVFGDEKAIHSADEALDRLIGRSPQSLEATRKILEDWAPDLIDDIKSVVIRRAVERSRNPASAASLDVHDLSQLANNLAGKSKGVGEIGKGLFTAAEQAEIQSAAQALRVLQETHMDRFNFQSASNVSDAAINVISRSPEFFARWMTRLMGQSKTLEAALNDPAARQNLIFLAERGPNSELGRAAVVYLSVMMGEAEAEATEERRRAEKQAELEQARGRIKDSPFTVQ